MLFIPKLIFVDLQCILKISNNFFFDLFYTNITTIQKKNFFKVTYVSINGLENNYSGYKIEIFKNFLTNFLILYLV